MIRERRFAFGSVHLPPGSPTNLSLSEHWNRVRLIEHIAWDPSEGAGGSEYFRLPHGLVDVHVDGTSGISVHHGKYWYPMDEPDDVIRFFTTLGLGGYVEKLLWKMLAYYQATGDHLPDPWGRR